MSIFTIKPTNPLTPSELILLNGEQFAEKAMWGNVTLLDGKTKVKAGPLVTKMIIAAILVNEKLGAIRLEEKERQKNVVFPHISLIAVWNNTNVTWPEYSLEYHVLQASKLRNDWVDDIIYVWLEESSPNPWLSAVELIKRGMARRELLEANVVNNMKFIVKTYFKLKESTVALAAQHPISPIHQVLAEYKQTHTEVWNLLERKVKHGVKSREITRPIPTG